MAETREGGVYKVGDEWQNANGEKVKAPPSAKEAPPEVVEEEPEATRRGPGRPRNG